MDVMEEEWPIFFQLEAIAIIWNVSVTITQLRCYFLLQTSGYPRRKFFANEKCGYGNGEAHNGRERPEKYMHGMNSSELTRFPIKMHAQTILNGNKERWVI